MVVLAYSKLHGLRLLAEAHARLPPEHRQRIGLAEYEHVQGVATRDELVERIQALAARRQKSERILVRADPASSLPQLKPQSRSHTWENAPRASYYVKNRLLDWESNEGFPEEKTEWILLPTRLRDEFNSEGRISLEPGNILQFYSRQSFTANELSSLASLDEFLHPEGRKKMMTAFEGAGLHPQAMHEFVRLLAEKGIPFRARFVAWRGQAGIPEFYDLIRYEDEG